MAAIIYQITNTVTNEFYVGKSVRSLKIRWAAHVRHARKPSVQTHLHRAIRKYGKNAFTLCVLETLTPEQNIDEREKYYIGSLLPEYNHTPGGDGREKGYHHTPETRAKLSAFARRNRTPEQLTALQAAGLSARKVAIAQSSMVGQQFGEWTVVSPTTNIHGSHRWSCICSCGTIGKVTTYYLKSAGSTRCKSCASRAKANRRWASSTARLTSAQ